MTNARWCSGKGITQAPKAPVDGQRCPGASPKGLVPDLRLHYFALRTICAELVTSRTGEEWSETHTPTPGASPNSHDIGCRMPRSPSFMEEYPADSARGVATGTTTPSFRSHGTKAGCHFPKWFFRVRTSNP